MAASLCKVFSSLCIKNNQLSLLKQVVSPAVLPYQFQSVRHKMVRPLRGCGRPVQPDWIMPEANKYRFQIIYPKDGQYTTKCLKLRKLGGRHPETGRVIVGTLGGGMKRKYRWLKTHLYPQPGETIKEKVQFTRYCPVRSARIAFVQTGESSRWIIAADKMQAGDIITSHGDIPRIPVRPKEGDSHPIGALPIGTSIFNIEVTPGLGGTICKAAGTSATVSKKLPDGNCILQLPSKREVAINEKCMVTVGRASNPDHGKIPIGSPNRLRWLGFRPRSGLRRKKDGYCGRKLHPPKPLHVYPVVKKEKYTPYIINF